MRRFLTRTRRICERQLATSSIDSNYRSLHVLLASVWHFGDNLLSRLVSATETVRSSCDDGASPKDFLPGSCDPEGVHGDGIATSLSAQCRAAHEIQGVDR